MSAKQHSFRLTLVSVALLTAFGEAAAQDASVEVLTRPDSQVSAGVGYWTDDRQGKGHRQFPDRGSTAIPRT